MNRIFNIVKEKATFLLSFVFSKGVVFFTPLLFAEILAPDVFGKLEYALAGLGFVLSALLNLGVPAAYPYFLLRERKTSVNKGYTVHLALLAAFFLLHQLVYFITAYPVEYYMVFNVTFIIANQVYYSTRLKTVERPIKAIFLDSGIYLLLLVAWLLFYFKFLPPTIYNISIFISVYATIYFFIAVRGFVAANKTGIFKQYRNILSYSINVMLGSFFIFLLTASGRILVEYFFSFEIVGVYAYYFRISAVAVMVHQMVSILYFRKLYTVSPDILDKYYAFFFFGITVLSLMIFIIAPYILTPISSFFAKTYETYKSVYLILSFQMTMWIATALNSSVIDRESLAKTNNKYFFVLILLSAILLLLLSEKLDLKVLVYIHMSIIFLAALIQYASLYRKNILFKRSIFTLCTLYAIASILCFALV